jgi:hypothetical protein
MDRIYICCLLCGFFLLSCKKEVDKERKSILLNGTQYKIWKVMITNPLGSGYLYFDDQGTFANLEFENSFSFKSSDYRSFTWIWHLSGNAVFHSDYHWFTLFQQRGDTLPVTYPGQLDTVYLIDQFPFYEPKEENRQHR